MANENVQMESTLKYLHTVLSKQNTTETEDIQEEDEQEEQVE